MSERENSLVHEAHRAMLNGAVKACLAKFLDADPAMLTEHDVAVMGALVNHQAVRTHLELAAEERAWR